MIGPSLAHYRLLRRLGAGGMSEVYEAEDTRLHRKVALKILPQCLATHPETLDRFQREARALAAINHPNIVTLYSVEQAGETHFITMELVEGRPLSDLIPSNGFELEQLLALGIALTDALAAAHARGISHRDLKPSNVMVNDQGWIKVIDFGLAKLFQPDPRDANFENGPPHQTGDGQILGTPAYMSPEQIEARKVDQRTDIFSLGILLCEMATAQRPFTGDSTISIMSSILRDAPPSLIKLKTGLPEDLDRIIRRCLQKKPDERYQSARDLLSDLEALATATQRSPSPTLAQSNAAPTRLTSSIHPNNLPAPLTSFVGRERETIEVTRLLDPTPRNGAPGNRLLTLIGPGGTGKTRLALQVAASLLERFPDGVWLVELAALSDPTLVPQTVATAMGLLNTAGGPPVELLTRHLATKRSLLLLDNCEHLVAACAQLTEALLRACPDLQIMATSREGLRLTGETTWPVPSLSVPNLVNGPLDEDSLIALRNFESIQLFSDRAQAVIPNFTLNQHNLAAVARLCHRLDGIPLAIELAAARTRLLPVEQLLDRIQDRFRLLTGGSRTALPRQQTLRALVDWSYELLSEPERVLFERLSVFAGGWTLEAAESVGADEAFDGTNDETPAAAPLRSEDVLDLLGHLVEKSMVVAEASPEGTARYRLLETLRQYAQERLAARSQTAPEALRTRHAKYFAAQAEVAAAGLHGPDQARWLERIEIEHDNLRAGLEWGKASDASPDRVELALRLAAPLYLPWLRQGHGREGRQHFEALLAHPSAQRPTRARAQVLFAVGSFALWQDGEAIAWTLLNESLALAQQLGDTHVMADAHHNLGVVLSNRGNHAGARHHHEEALRLTRADGDLSGIRWSLEDLADVADDEGDPERGSKIREEALSLARQIGDHHAIASILQSMGNLARAAGKVECANRLIREGLSLMQEIGCQHCSARCLRDLAFVAGGSGEPERAVRLLGATEALRERTGIVVPTVSLSTIERTLGDARHQLGEAAYATAWNEGLALSLPQATDYAMGTSQRAPVS